MLTIGGAWAAVRIAHGFLGRNPFVLYVLIGVALAAMLALRVENYADGRVERDRLERDLAAQQQIQEIRDADDALRGSTDDDAFDRMLDDADPALTGLTQSYSGARAVDRQRFGGDPHGPHGNVSPGTISGGGRPLPAVDGIRGSAAPSELRSVSGSGTKRGGSSGFVWALICLSALVFAGALAWRFLDGRISIGAGRWGPAGAGGGAGEAAQGSTRFGMGRGGDNAGARSLDSWSSLGALCARSARASGTLAQFLSRLALSFVLMAGAAWVAVRYEADRIHRLECVRPIAFEWEQSGPTIYVDLDAIKLDDDCEFKDPIIAMVDGVEMPVMFDVEVKDRRAGAFSIRGSFPVPALSGPISVWARHTFESSKRTQLGVIER